MIIILLHLEITTSYLEIQQNKNIIYYFTIFLYINNVIISKKHLFLSSVLFLRPLCNLGVRSDK
jgi:hypothetical protein